MPSRPNARAGSRLAQRASARRGARLEAGEHLFERALVGPDEWIGLRCRREHVEELRYPPKSGRQVMVPALQRLPPGETVGAFNLSATRLGFDEYDVASQG
jgi:hypothetical protein